MNPYIPPPNPWLTHSVTEVHCNRFWRVDHHKVTRPDGTLGDFFVIPRPDCAKLIGITTGGEIVMIGRWMLSTGKWSVELPGGSPRPGEDLLETAHRELLTETGYTAPGGAVAEYLGSGDLLNSLFPSQWHAYVVRGVVQAEDATERALRHGTQDIRTYTPSVICDLMDRSEWVTCSVDQAVLGRLFRRYKFV